MADQPTSNSTAIDGTYGAFYQKRNPVHVYPVEFVVRAFLGNYPRHKTDAASYQGKRVLDLGCGDGRNMPLLHNLGMEIHGTEISQEICDLTAARMQNLGISATLEVGRNHELPYPDGHFDVVLACHACYYIDPGTRFSDNVNEIARVMRGGGSLIFSAPIGTTYVLRGAKDLGDGHMEIADDPYGLRNGYVLKKFDNEAEIEAALRPAFTHFEIGSCRNDFWGIEEHVWTVACRKAV
ncbi:class I SAM-dependent methyltransferase [Bradyrhizobium ivorense]|uniref:class I SAM-dependent methyltransferase n=1 Tax=Bradyrhizobium ivorense TaxID=2511166 RepID=UPI0010AF9240|nr:class I SAM-dependent methyltransferase [Bradyrhizobium ivorense]VIO77457.1 putative methyltransferase [Bradyrhizobium ivorense]